MTRRSRIVGFGSAALLVLLGVGSAVAFSGGLGQNLAFALVALGLVLATSLVFYEVGLTEDRDRKRESAERDREREREERATERAREQEREQKREREDATKLDHPPERSGRIRFERMRGHPRRLR